MLDLAHENRPVFVDYLRRHPEATAAMTAAYQADGMAAFRHAFDRAWHTAVWTARELAALPPASKARH
jgi:hypothetical protein